MGTCFTSSPASDARSIDVVKLAVGAEGALFELPPVARRPLQSQKGPQPAASSTHAAAPRAAAARTRAKCQLAVASRAMMIALPDGPLVPNAELLDDPLRAIHALEGHGARRVGVPLDFDAAALLR